MAHGTPGSGAGGRPHAIGLMAPRPLYVSSAEEDKSSDPLTEHLSLVEASSVCLLGKIALTDGGMPDQSTCKVRRGGLSRAKREARRYGVRVGSISGVCLAAGWDEKSSEKSKYRQFSQAVYGSNRTAPQELGRGEGEHLG